MVMGCSSLDIHEGDAYPFRAEIQGRAHIKGRELIVTGGLCIESDGMGIVQVYGPAGIGAYTMQISLDRLIISDMWGRLVEDYEIPVNIISTLAGVPPRGAYLLKRRVGEDIKVTYTWGYIVLDGNLLPEEIHMRTDPAMDIFFRKQGRTIRLMIEHGSDKYDLKVLIQEGGRWL